MKYRICPYCGAHLDHGERCDCQEAHKTQRESDEKPAFTGIPVQMVFFTDRPGKVRKTA